MAERFDELPEEKFNPHFDIDETKLNRFLSKAGMDLDMEKEQALYELGCGELQGNEFIVNNAGVMFFAIKPERFIEQIYATCVRYHGNSMAKVIDRKDYYGDLLTLVDEAEAFVKRHTRLAYLFDGFKRIDIEEYPYNAIREAIINAVCHRDYFVKNNIFVNVFDDWVEVISPGSIPNNLTIKEVYGTSHPRNFKIVELFRKVGYVEKLGTGLKRMEELMLYHGLKKPQYEAGTHFFKVTFFGPKDKILELVKPSNVLDLREVGLNNRQIKALNYMQKKGPLLRQEYEKTFGASKVTAFRDLNELVEKGFIRAEGSSRSVKYFLNR